MADRKFSGMPVSTSMPDGAYHVILDPSQPILSNRNRILTKAGFLADILASIPSAVITLINTPRSDGYAVTADDNVNGVSGPINIFTGTTNTINVNTGLGTYDADAPLHFKIWNQGSGDLSIAGTATVDKPADKTLTVSSNGVATLYQSATDVFTVSGTLNDPSWEELMLASYRTLNPEQAVWFDSNPDIEAELLSRLSSGYLYDTFGPSGQNKAVCDFVYLLVFDGDITSRTVTKTGDALRWDFDGTVYTQDNMPAHTLGAGDGILTVSSTDGWGGVTDFRLHLNNFYGACPTFNLPNVVLFYIYDNSFSGAAPLWDFPNVTGFSIYSNSFSGATPLWDFPDVTDFRIHTNSFTDFSAFLANLHTEWDNKVGACSLQIQNNSATLSGAYADEDPPTTDIGYIYELENDPEATGYPVYTITYDAP